MGIEQHSQSFLLIIGKEIQAIRQFTVRQITSAPTCVIPLCESESQKTFVI